MDRPTIILATSNGIGMGHLARATAIAEELKKVANPVIVSVAGGVAEIGSAMGIRCEYIPGKTRGWMPRSKWDSYFRDRLLAIAEETHAQVITFDGVVPYPGFIATKNSNRNLTTVWVRRGFWQKNLLRFVLPFQSRVVDYIVEPGDFASEYDHGPTSGRKEAHVTSPVSLYKVSDSLSREDARKALNLDLSKPAVLVQLGTGDGDMNQKMTAALSGLIGWKDLQIVLTKEPVDSNGNSLVPEGLEVRIIRYFPLSRVLQAFDAAIAATGYNSVHELLPAHIPSVFISNIRGTDDQDARAQWCHDRGFALRASHDDLENITATVAQLQSESKRNELALRCSQLPAATGAIEIAQHLLSILNTPKKDSLLQSFLRVALVRSLHFTALVYRTIRPHAVKSGITSTTPVFSDETDAGQLRNLIKGSVPFEHLIIGASDAYVTKRKSIAQKYYR